MLGLNTITMQYKKRKTNGQFRSKKASERLFHFHMSLVIAYLLTPVAIGIIFGESTVVYQAEAHEPEEVEVIEVTEDMLPEYWREKTPVERAIHDIPHESEKTTAVIEYLYAEAPKHGIDPDTVAHTIYCESMFYNIQSGVVVNGVREPSYGLAQIHLPSHPTVSVEQALNPYFAVDWMLEHWDLAEWYGYDRSTDSCTNDIAEYWN